MQIEPDPKLYPGRKRLAVAGLEPFISQGIVIILIYIDWYVSEIPTLSNQLWTSRSFPWLQLWWCIMPYLNLLGMLKPFLIFNHRNEMISHDKVIILPTLEVEPASEAAPPPWDLSRKWGKKAAARSGGTAGNFNLTSWTWSLKLQWLENWECIVLCRKLQILEGLVSQFWCY